MRRVLPVLVTASVTWLACASAFAHPEWSPVRVNRYAKLVFGEKSRIVYTVLYGDGPALPERKAVDADGNGQLDAHERELLGQRIGAMVGAGLSVTLDGKPFALPTPSADVGLAGEAVAPEPFSVDLTYALVLPPGPHDLTIDDRVIVTNEGDSEIAIDATPPARVIAAGRGATASGKEQLFRFTTARFSLLEDRRVTVRFEAAPPTLASKLRAELVAHALRDSLVFALLLLLGLGAGYRSMKG